MEEETLPTMLGPGAYSSPIDVPRNSRRATSCATLSSSSSLRLFWNNHTSYEMRWRMTGRSPCPPLVPLVEDFCNKIVKFKFLIRKKPWQQSTQSLQDKQILFSQNSVKDSFPTQFKSMKHR
eukprot:m.215363 g.215363  ORF g.215363 m.215363 type:complete len:122 (+) comp39833_c2_seq6:87-452(+)